MSAPRKPTRKSKKKAPALELRTGQGTVARVTAASLAKRFDDEHLGEFAVLAAGPGRFIQTACEWSPDPSCATFMRAHGSEPWVLEYRQTASGPQYRTRGHVTLAQAKAAFLAWLAGEDSWRTAHRWEVLDLTGDR